MAAPPQASIAAAVHRLQIALLDGAARSDSHLLLASVLLSRPDYEDVVLERSISGLCGHPPCSSPLTLSSADDTVRRLGRYHISLREHRVYDLEETYKYCSSQCLVSSRAFSATLGDERVSDLSLERIERVLRSFGIGEGDEGQSLEEDKGLGFADLRINEKEDAGAGVVSIEQWIGPANAIEGYVPLHDRNQESKFASKLNSGKRIGTAGSSESSLTSDIAIGDEFNADPSKTCSTLMQDVSEVITKKFEEVILEEKKSVEQSKSKSSKTRPAKNINEKVKVEGFRSALLINGNEVNASLPKASNAALRDLLEPLSKKLEDGIQLKKKTVSGITALKSSLKGGRTKTERQTVTWVDERETETLKDKTDGITSNNSTQGLEEEDIDSSLRRASAEACAAAMTKAAKAVASGESETVDAVSEAGIMILPQPQQDKDQQPETDEDMFDLDQGYVKWPKKIVLLDTDMFEVEDSWHDTPPEGFSLTLSSFATMWMALFGWVTCSSLAYIYGRNESSADEFLLVSGREYPRKIVLKDGKSGEIRRTLDVCISRAIPGLVMDLRLPIPVSTVEKAVGHLLDTMSFVDALPPFRTRQWNVIVLLLIDALSVHRLPALSPFMTSKNVLLHKILGGAQMSVEEYETIRDLMMPLGRLPQFSMQSGG